MPIAIGPAAAAWPTASMAQRRLQQQKQQYRLARPRAAPSPSPLRPTPPPPPLGCRCLPPIPPPTASSSSSSSLTLPPKRRPPSVTPARQRRRDKRAEQEGEGVDLRPGAQGFDQRFASAVRAARGPRALGRLLGRRAYLRAAPAPVLATAMAVAAGLASARVAEEVVEAVGAAAVAAARNKRRRRGDDGEGEDEGRQRQPPRDAAVVLLSGGAGSSSSPAPTPFPLDSDQYPTRLSHCRALAATCAAELRERLASLGGGEDEEDGAFPPTPPSRLLLLTPIDQARAAHSLARLGLYDPELLLLLRQTFFSSSSQQPPPPSALACMASALAAFSHPPPSKWLARWRLESFRALGTFDAQQLASAAFALVRLSRMQDEEEQEGLSVRPSALAAASPWLELASRAMRARWQEGRLSSGARAKGAGRACHPQSLVRFAVALAEASADGGGGGGNDDDGEDDDHGGLLLSPAGPGALADLPPLQHQNHHKTAFRPSFNWLAGFCAEARRSADALAPRELAALMWALARFSSSSSSAAASSSSRRSNSSFTPDSAFLATWCRAAAAKMPAFDARSLSVALEALAVVAGEQRGGSGGASAAPPPFELPGRFASTLLARSRPLLPRMKGERLAALLWALAALRVRPSAGWLLAWVDAFSPKAGLVPTAAAAARAPVESSSSSLPPPLPAHCLADVAWALARLRLDPGPAWLRALYDAAEAAVPTASAADLAALAWAAGALPGEEKEEGNEEGRRARGRPRRAWLAALGARARDAAAACSSSTPEAERRRRVVEALAAFVADEVTAGPFGAGGGARGEKTIARRVTRN